MTINRDDEYFGFGGDPVNPAWDEPWEVHNWRNYINEELREMWETFTPEQKLAIARMAEQLARNEDWD